MVVGTGVGAVGTGVGVVGVWVGVTGNDDDDGESGEVSVMRVS